MVNNLNTDSDKVGILVYFECNLLPTDSTKYDNNVHQESHIIPAKIKNNVTYISQWKKNES